MRAARWRGVASVAVVGVLLGACSDSDDSTVGGGTTSSTTTTAAAERLTVLVTNDDGIGAAGIDALVNALAAVDDIDVVVVAPAENKSGSSDTTTDGAVEHRDAATASGVPGTAVEGFPADTIAVALDELGIEPDVVVSGVNSGQNVGTFVELSGTVGAARAALRRGIPAVAVSAGIDAPAGYELGAELVVEWVVAHRAELAAGTVPVEAVVSYNVPDCQAGTPKDPVEVAVASSIPQGVNVFETADCAVVVAEPPADDVAAMVGGYVSVSEVPADL